MNFVSAAAAVRPYSVERVHRESHQREHRRDGEHREEENVM